ncbi:MAG TPA: VWA domain-containing protein [Polyangium sp.]|nr:VWA domain-containing protein [Polyangium sp.]
MKLAALALYSIMGVSAAASAGYMLAARPTDAKPQVVGESAPTGATVSINLPVAPEAAPTFSAGTTLRVEGRLGNAFLAKGSSSKTFLLLDVHPGQTDAAAKPVEGHLAIVIDRSGSMKGDRLPKALEAARAAVDKLNPGDRVSVISFDTSPRIDVPMVEVTGNNRQQIKDAIDRITLGGDTCISCALTSALNELGQSVGLADRMIVLSDGEPTAGVRDEAGFFPVAKSARDASVGITTIGVGTSYNHKIMGAIALGSGGNHYFIEDPSSLEKAFLAEADKLKATVALAATATITLAEGVSVERVFDRSFEREGNRIKVQLGNFSTGDTRTVLMELAVPTGNTGIVPVADVNLAYDDRVLGTAGRCEGKLSVAVKGDVDAPSEQDAQVATRVARSKTAATLSEVNELIEQGRVQEAEQKIQVQQQELAAAAEKAKRSAAPGKSDKIAGDYAGQADTLTNAREGLDAKKAGAKPRAVRKNVEMMNPYML